jgi:putative membrane protein
MNPPHKRSTSYPTPEGAGSFNPAVITRPAPVLLRYYLVVALLSVFGFPFVFLPLYFRYRTLQFRFDEQGIALSWGILFRKEVHLTYQRIQDIHLTRNILQRWMGLATVEIQTASGSASAEMTIEGVLQAELLRDYLYSRMRGARESQHQDEASQTHTDLGTEALSLLREISTELRRLRQALEAKPGS